MYVYTTKGRQKAPISTLVPYSPARPLPYQPQSVLGNTSGEAPQPVPMPTGVVHVALAVAVGFVGYSLWRKMRGQPMVPNFMPPWPGIGPLFSYADGIGRAYALTPFIV